ALAIRSARIVMAAGAPNLLATLAMKCKVNSLMARGGIRIGNIAAWRRTCRCRGRRSRDRTHSCRQQEAGLGGRSWPRLVSGANQSVQFAPQRHASQAICCVLNGRAGNAAQFGLDKAECCGVVLRFRLAGVTCCLDRAAKLINL